MVEASAHAGSEKSAVGIYQRAFGSEAESSLPKRSHRSDVLPCIRLGHRIGLLPDPHPLTFSYSALAQRSDAQGAQFQADRYAAGQKYRGRSPFRVELVLLKRLGANVFTDDCSRSGVRIGQTTDTVKHVECRLMMIRYRKLDQRVCKTGSARSRLLGTSGTSRTTG